MSHQAKIRAMICGALSLSVWVSGCMGELEAPLDSEAPIEEVGHTGDELRIGGSLGAKKSGWDSCVDRCTDRFLDCQFDNPSDSLDNALCEQQFNRCVQWCDWVYPKNGGSFGTIMH